MPFGLYLKISEPPKIANNQLGNIQLNTSSKTRCGLFIVHLFSIRIQCLPIFQLTQQVVFLY